LRGRVGEDEMQAWVERIAAREVDVYTAVQSLLAGTRTDIGERG
jgi:hypothetical protein